MAARNPLFTLVAQASLGAGALLAMAFAPPTTGQMTIVSLRGQSGDQIAAWGIGDDLALVASGQHSLTVNGNRAGLVLHALRHGALVIAARPALCGGESTKP